MKRVHSISKLKTCLKGSVVSLSDVSFLDVRYIRMEHTKNC